MLIVQPASHIAIAGSPATMMIASAHAAVAIMTASNGKHQIETLLATKNEQTITGLAVSSTKGETRAAVLLSDGALSLHDLGASSR